MSFEMPGQPTEEQPAEGEVAPIEAEITEKLVDSRELYGGRLAEYLTGLKLDDPKLIERLVNDQQLLRAKYDLPPREMRSNEPLEFERKLKEISDKYKVRIDAKSDCGDFFTNSPAGAVYFGGGRIGADINRESINSLALDLGKLEHELVHAMQDVRSPGMPIELQEYEAYIAGSNLQHLQEAELSESDRVESIKSFFEYLIGGSVNFWYEHETKTRGVKVTPKWDDPEFFNKTEEKAEQLVTE